MESSGADAVELWVKEGQRKHFRCSVSRSARMPFGFILVPSPLGEEPAGSLDDGTGGGLERLCCKVIKGDLDSHGHHVTEQGSFWAAEAAETVVLSRAGSHADDPGGLSQVAYEGLALIPVGFQAECVGLLQLKSRRKGHFSLDEVLSASSGSPSRTSTRRSSSGSGSRS